MQRENQPEADALSPDRSLRTGRFVTVGGGAVHVLRAGAGPRVLLLHGNNSLGRDILSVFEPCSGMTWIAPDRPGYGFSEPPPPDREDPISLGLWIEQLLDAMGIRQLHIVAHSFAAAGGLCFTSRNPDRVQSLTLISPICRPAPHHRMSGLRVAEVPVVGRLADRVLAPILARLSRHVPPADAHDDAGPDALADTPLAPARQLRGTRTRPADLRQFNRVMMRADPRVDPSVPVVAMFGGADPAASADWQAPWLRERVAKLDLRILPGQGHMLHHAKPVSVWAAVLSGIAAGRGPLTPGAGG